MRGFALLLAVAGPVLALVIARAGGDGYLLLVLALLPLASLAVYAYATRTESERRQRGAREQTGSLGGGTAAAGDAARSQRRESDTASEEVERGT